MGLLFKHISKEFAGNKSMVAVLSLFLIFISFMYFFVHFSIDKNLTSLNKALVQNGSLSASEIQYHIALNNNQTLIRNITLAMMSIFTLVLYLFVKNHISKSKIHTAQILSMGFMAKDITGIYMLLTAGISIICAMAGLVSGYFGSDILIEANRQTYLVENIVKGIHRQTLLTGVFLTTMYFCIVTYVSCIGLGKNDVALMMKPMDAASKSLGIAGTIINKLPLRNKFKFKLTMKSISAVFLLVVAVAVFNIMFILSVSLIFSGNEILKSQTMNRSYLYDINYENYRIDKEISTEQEIYYLKCEGSIEIKGNLLQYDIVGLENTNVLFELVDQKKRTIDIQEGFVANPELEENYGIKVGDMISLTVEEKNYKIPVAAIAVNADLKTVYLPKQYLAAMIQQDSLVYNGILTNQYRDNGTAIAFGAKVSSIKRSLTSNRASAVINQSIGVITGCLLIYLALLIGLNNNRKSVLIFDLLGYNNREINRILLNPYMLVSNILFWILIPISIYTAKSIQIRTSIQTNEYMPFQINVIMLVYMLLILNLICFGVKVLFVGKIKGIMNAGRQSEYLNEW
jgi:hypothetical protein